MLLNIGCDGTSWKGFWNHSRQPWTDRDYVGILCPHHDVTKCTLYLVVSIPDAYIGLTHLNC
jgi:hypothetical protein